MQEAADDSGRACLKYVKLLFAVSRNASSARELDDATNFWELIYPRLSGIILFLRVSIDGTDLQSQV
jgi:hypothetical protein